MIVPYINLLVNAYNDRNLPATIMATSSPIKLPSHSPIPTELREQPGIPPLVTYPARYDCGMDPQLRG